MAPDECRLHQQTNERYARLREGFVNTRNVNMFVFRFVVSLQMPGLYRKSLLKITSFVYNSRVVKVYAMNKLFGVLRNFGIVVSNPDGPYLFI